MVAGVVDAAAVGEGELGADAVAAGVARAVGGGGGGGGGVGLDPLDDVLLTAAGPGIGVDVGAEHPEGGPEAVADGELHAGFDAAVLEGFEALGFEAGGGPLAAGGFDGLDDEVAVAVHVGVGGGGGAGRGVGAGGAVVFDFGVAEAAVAGVVGPGGGVGEGAGGAVELVGPLEGPGLGGEFAGEKGGQGEEEDCGC